MFCLDDIDRESREGVEAIIEGQEGIPSVSMISLVSKGSMSKSKRTCLRGGENNSQGLPTLNVTRGVAASSSTPPSSRPPSENRLAETRLVDAVSFQRGLDQLLPLEVTCPFGSCEFRLYNHEGVWCACGGWGQDLQADTPGVWVAEIQTDRQTDIGHLRRCDTICKATTDRCLQSAGKKGGTNKRIRKKTES